MINLYWGVYELPVYLYTSHKKLELVNYKETCLKISKFFFFALNVTFQVFAHDSIFDNLRLRIEVVSTGFLPTARSDVSSANKRISDSRSFWISFIKIMNKRGPNLLPADKFTIFDFWPSITTIHQKAWEIVLQLRFG